MTIDVGGHLRAVRMMFGLSQRELAKRAGVTNGTISLIEQNRVSPSVSSLKKVLDGVPMSLAEFFTLDLASDPQVFYGRRNLRISVIARCRYASLLQSAPIGR
jgi:transcriptional regulator with XRE-family HTH domain